MSGINKDVLKELKRFSKGWKTKNRISSFFDEDWKHGKYESSRILNLLNN